MYRNETRQQSHATAPYQRRAAQPYIVQHDFDGPAELTTTLAHALSDVSGVDVTDTGFTLYDYIDPDALDQLFTPTDDSGQRINGALTFTVWRHQVTVHSDGRIVIVPPQPTR